MASSRPCSLSVDCLHTDLNNCPSGWFSRGLIDCSHSGLNDCWSGCLIGCSHCWLTEVSGADGRGGRGGLNGWPPGWLIGVGGADGRGGRGGGVGGRPYENSGGSSGDWKNFGNRGGGDCLPTDFAATDCPRDGGSFATDCPRDDDSFGDPWDDRDEPDRE